MKVTDIAKTINNEAEQKEIGIRPGEKLHEQMIGEDDAIYTYEYSDYYKILPSINEWCRDKNRVGKGKKVADNFTYTSNNNKEWMEISELRSWIDDNIGKIGKF